MRYAPLIILLLFVSLSFASEIWKYSTDGAINAKPLIYQGLVVVASDDGSVYAINPATGAKKWNAFVGLYPNEVLLFNNAVVTSVSDGSVVEIGANGKPVWTTDLNTTAYNVSYVYGAAADSKFIFVTTNVGLFELDTNGIAKNVYPFNSTTGPPTAGPDFVVFGRGDELDKVLDSGALAWKTSIEGGSFWLSRPAIDSEGVYIGGLDGKLHDFAISNGVEFWNVPTGGWVDGSPLVSQGNIYFGSDDGKMYAVDSSGQAVWTSSTGLAIQTQPEFGTMGGDDVVFVGGSDKEIYAMSTDSGQILWESPTEGAVGSPLFYQSSVIFGSGDGNVYAFSTDRACSITSPHEGDNIGLKELDIEGNFVSAADNAQVSVKINDGDWQDANMTQNGWTYYTDPSTALVPDLNTISCKVSDSNGDESGDTYTMVTVNHDPNVPLSDITITVSPDIIEKQPFTIFVNDASDGSPIERFTLISQGNNYTGDENYNLTINDPGSYKITVKKIGFNDATVSVNVNANGVNPLFLVIGAIAIIAIVWAVWGQIKKRGVKKVTPQSHF